MILLCGIPSEPPLRLAIEAAERLGVDHRVVNQRAAAQTDIAGAVRAGRVTGRLWLAGEEIDLARVDGVYLRMTEPTLLPESRWAPVVDPDGPARAAALTQLVADWCETTERRVANRLSSMASNTSKPYQARLIRARGLPVPETLVTSDPAAVREFAARVGRVVYKSTSSLRSVVHELDVGHADLGKVRHLPTQFQALVVGLNVRVHVVGDAVFACAVRADTVDYRYPGPAGADMEVVALPEGVAAACLAVAQALDLPLCGLDLIHGDDGTWWCLEANPSPAYSCFEEPTGLPIAAALVRWLATGTAVSGRAVA